MASVAKPILTMTVKSFALLYSADASNNFIWSGSRYAISCSSIVNCLMRSTGFLCFYYPISISSLNIDFIQANSRFNVRGTTVLTRSGRYISPFSRLVRQSVKIFDVNLLASGLLMLLEINSKLVYTFSPSLNALPRASSQISIRANKHHLSFFQQSNAQLLLAPLYSFRMRPRLL